jgi:hypothetical protein
MLTVERRPFGSSLEFCVGRVPDPRACLLALSEIADWVMADVQRVVAQAALQLLDDHPKHTAPGGSWREALPTGR